MMGSLDVGAFVRALGEADIRCVLTGSVAARAWGVPCEPRDFDAAPELSAENLAQLAELLGAWGARPHYDPAWPQVTPEQCANWTPEPPTAENLDHLFETAFGLFDVVPARSGDYADLAPRAVSVEGVLVAHPRDLLRTLRPEREKHRERSLQLTELCERLERGDELVPVLPV